MIHIKKFVFVALLALIGCASVKNLPPDYTFNPSPEKGVLLASVSYHGSYSGYSIKFRKIGSTKWEKLEIGSGTAVLPPGMLDWDIEAPGLRGNVFAVELPEGEYEFASWFVSSGVASIGPLNPFSVKFKIYSGDVAYMGNFHFIRESGFGATVTGVNVNYKNEYDRDIQILKEKYNKLNLNLVRNSAALAKPASKLGAGNSATIFIMY